MTASPPQFVLRPMRLDDIPQVVQIDRLSFPDPWPPRTYQFEISNRETSHMVVLEQVAAADSNGGLGDWLRRFFKPRSPGEVVGYGGLWLIAGEAHISTIAVHPEARGRGLGELLLAGMLQRACNRGGEYSVLEVRVSNTNAQALYRKYGYEVVARRENYYRTNSEDALLMEVRPLDNTYQTRLAGHVAALRERLLFDDQYSA